MANKLDAAKENLIKCIHVHGLEDEKTKKAAFEFEEAFNEYRCPNPECKSTVLEQRLDCIRCTKCGMQGPKAETLSRRWYNWSLLKR